MKEKIVFVTKCIMVMLPFLLISLYAGLFKMYYMDQEAPFYLWNRDICQNTQKKTCDVLILGDSVANAAYMPQAISDHCLNLSLGGITPMETYYILKEYLENNPAPKTVYISFLDQHLQSEDCFWIRTMYSHRFKPSDNLSMLRDAMKKNETSVAVEDAPAQWLSYELYLPNKYITSLRKARLFTRLSENQAAYRLAHANNGRYIAGDTINTSQDKIRFDSFYVSPLFDEYYRKLIDLCLENNIKTYLIKLPMPKIAVYSEQYEVQLAEYYGALSTDYPQVIMDRWGFYETEYFMDEWHLNDTGAQRFANELKAKYPPD